MADKYINEVGLRIIKTWIESMFAKDTDLDTLSGRVDEIVTDYAKKTDLPAKTSDLTNDGDDGVSKFATEEYVDDNGGKIDSISINGTAQAIDSNKNVDLKIQEFAVFTYNQTTFAEIQAAASKPQILKFSGKEYVLSSGMKLNNNTNNHYYVEIGTLDSGVYSGHIITVDNQNNWMNEPLIMAIPHKTSQLLNDSDFQTLAEVQALIDAELAEIINWDLSKPMLELPETGKKGIIYLVAQGSVLKPPYDEWFWVEQEGSLPAHFEKFGTTDIDLSAYWSKTELTAMTTTDINNILNA